METRRGGLVNIVVIVVILLWTLATRNAEAKRVLKGRNMVARIGGQATNDDVAEKSWMHCRKELLTILKDPGENVDSCLWDKMIADSKSELPRRTNMDLTMSHLLSKRRKVLCHCLRKQNFELGCHSLGNDGSNHLVRCLRLVCCLPNTSRRPLSIAYYWLVSRSNESLSSFHSSTPSNPSTISQEEAESNSNPSAHLYFQKKLQTELDARNGSPDKSSPATHKHSPPSSEGSKHHKSNKKKKNDELQKETFVAIVATATATFCFVAMAFSCWFCCIRRKRSYGHRDDRPLLNLSDFSAGSSQSSISLTSSSKDYSFNSKKIASFRGNASMKQHGEKERHIEDASTLEAATEEGVPHLKPPQGRAEPPPPEPPPAPPLPGPRPPPPPRIIRPPPAPPKKGAMRPSSFGLHRRGPSDSSEPDDNESESGSSKMKLKPFFWDKVMANPGQSMVWHQLNDGSFQLNEEMIESLFGYNASESNKSNQKKSTSEPSFQFIQIIDPRKAQNLSILIRALNVTTEEVIDALQQGNQLPIELLQTLLKMQPTSEEELKLRLFAGDVSQLGPAEHFLKSLVEIPFAFKRIESLIFMGSMEEEVSSLKESFATLELACNKLRHSRLFLKLLEAVLKTGNRMNSGTYRGGAMAFKLDTLLKLSDVKGTDGKTTLLHFVVVEIIRSEGIRAVRAAKQIPGMSSVKSGISSVKSAGFVEDSGDQSEDHYRNLGLQVVSGLSTELEDVKKAAAIDPDILGTTLSKLRESLTKSKTFLNTEMKNLEEDGDFFITLESFIECVESDIDGLAGEEKRIIALVKTTADYFHGQSGRDEGLRLFVIVRDFLIMLDQACKQVRDDREKKKPAKETKKETLPSSPSSEHRHLSDLNRRRLFPAIAGRRIDSSSSDDESS